MRRTEVHGSHILWILIRNLEFNIRSEPDSKNSLKVRSGSDPGSDPRSNFSIEKHKTLVTSYTHDLLSSFLRINRKGANH